MKLKIMIMALLLMSVGIGSAVNRLPATEFTGDVGMGGYNISDAKINYTNRIVYFGPYDWCNYVADGVDDAATLQAAIDSVSGGLGGTVFVLPYNYEIEQQIVVRNRVKITSINSGSLQAKESYWNDSLAQAARMCITFNTSEAFKVRSGAVLEGLQFYYPGQVTNGTPLEYPATVYLIQYNSDHSVIRDCQFVNSYYAINATESGGAHIIQNCRGFALKYGYKADSGQGTTRIEHVSFSNAYWPDAESVLIQWVQENGVCFYLESEDWIRLSDVSCYGYKYGLYADGNADMYLTDAGFDACYLPAYLTNCKHPKISGGYFVAKPFYGDSVGYAGIQFAGTSVSAVVVGNVINSDTRGILGLPSNSVCVGNNIIDWGDGTTADLQAIHTAGNRVTISANVMSMSAPTALTTGVYSSGCWNVISNNVIADHGTYGIQLAPTTNDNIISSNSIVKSTGAYWKSSGARNIINGIGYNVGNPASTGDWKTYGQEGISVVDTGNNTIYQYANGGWRALN